MLLGFLLLLGSCNYINSLYNVSDDILFNFKWLEKSSSVEEADDGVQIRTNLGESYFCSLPPVISRKHSDISFSSVNETALLQSLFSQQTCVYKAESYWTYEFCHKQHIRQFHEEHDQAKKNVLTQEYYLGYYNRNKNTESQNSGSNVVSLGEFIFPYFGVNFTDGTICDLNKQHRTTTVMYICYENIGNRILDVSEVASCSYQLIFATKYLCSHPSFQRRRTIVNPISCHPNADSSSKPLALAAFEVEKEKFKSKDSNDFASLLGIITADKMKRQSPQPSVEESSNLVKEQSTTVKHFDMFDASVPTRENEIKDRHSTYSAPYSLVKPEHKRTATNRQIYDFLQGKLCLTGQTGWWAHEVCFNRHVRQYHEDTSTKQHQGIILGTWDLGVHVQWLQDNPNQRPSHAHNRNQVQLYYGDGDYCELASTSRTTVVRLKCLTSTSSAIHLSFSEPKPCHYSITVENAAFCDLLLLADENGILPESVLNLQ